MPSIKEAAAAFLADQRVAVSGVSRNPRSHGSNLVYQRLRARGLDHAVWFQEPFRADDWLLSFQESPAASGACGLARGQVVRRDGRLVASVVYGMQGVTPRIRGRMAGADLPPGAPQRRWTAPTGPLTNLVERRRLARCANDGLRAAKGGLPCVLRGGRPYL
jgi:Acyl-CoA thioesterase